MGECHRVEVTLGKPDCLLHFFLRRPTPRSVRHRNVAQDVERNASIHLTYKSRDLFHLFQAAEIGVEDSACLHFQTGFIRTAEIVERGGYRPAGILLVQLLIKRLEADVAAIEVFEHEPGAVRVSQPGRHTKFLFAERQHFG